MKKRVSQYMISSECPLCHGKRLRREALSVKFAGLDVAETSRLPLKRLAELLKSFSAASDNAGQKQNPGHPEKAIVVRRIAENLTARLSVFFTSASGTSRWNEARRHCRPANCNGCGWRRRSGPIFSAWSTFSMNPRPGCIPKIPRRY
jgi:predicted Zn-ribbon and HTH transcriptional regulator